MSSITDPETSRQSPRTVPTRAATVNQRRDYYLGELLAQAERDAAAQNPSLPYNEAVVREHLIYTANGGNGRNVVREHDALRTRLLLVAKRVADEWSLPFDLDRTRAHHDARAATAPGQSKTIDALRARAVVPVVRS